MKAPPFTTYTEIRTKVIELPDIFLLRWLIFEMQFNLLLQYHSVMYLRFPYLVDDTIRLFPISGVGGVY